VKRWVFNPALNCPRLMDDERSCDVSAFQTIEAASWPRCVLVEGTSMSWRSAERRFARPEMPATGMQSADIVEVGRTVLTDTVKRRDCYFELYSLWHGRPMKTVAKGRRDVFVSVNTDDQTGGSVQDRLVWCILD